MELTFTSPVSFKLALASTAVLKVCDDRWKTCGVFLLALLSGWTLCVGEGEIFEADASGLQWVRSLSDQMLESCGFTGTLIFRR